MPTTNPVFLTTDHADGTDPSAHPCHSCNPWLKAKTLDAGINPVAAGSLIASPHAAETFRPRGPCREGLSVLFQCCVHADAGPNSEGFGIGAGPPAFLHA